MVGILKLFTTALAGLVSLASAAELRQVTDFGSNPSGVRMFIYVPDTVAPNPAIIAVVHWCGGTAQAYYEGSQYALLADQYGFIVIYPDSPYSGGCWDVSSDRSLKRNGGGDTQGIASMVTYTIGQYQADATRVFITGTSSGAMMTNVMASTYPDLFRAASLYAGVPAGCFYTGTVNDWNSTCSAGQSIQTPEQWAQTARNMYPGYNGSRPKMFIYHGINDEVLNFQNYKETIKQWTAIFGYDTQPDSVTQNNPATSWTKEVYGANVVGAIGDGIPHNLPRFEQEDMKWFGIV